MDDEWFVFMLQTRAHWFILLLQGCVFVVPHTHIALHDGGYERIGARPVVVVSTILLISHIITSTIRVKISFRDNVGVALVARQIETAVGASRCSLPLLLLLLLSLLLSLLSLLLLVGT